MPWITSFKRLFLVWPLYRVRSTLLYVFNRRKSVKKERVILYQGEKKELFSLLVFLSLPLLSLWIFGLFLSHLSLFGFLVSLSLSLSPLSLWLFGLSFFSLSSFFGFLATLSLPGVVVVLSLLGGVLWCATAALMKFAAMKRNGRERKGPPFPFPPFPTTFSRKRGDTFCTLLFFVPYCSSRTTFFAPLSIKIGKTKKSNLKFSWVIEMERK